MRLADAVGWFGPAGLALCVLGTVVPLAGDVAVALALGTTATLGVGHGALDHELPERLRNASRGATTRIAVMYAAVVGAGFVTFLAAPLPLLGVFLVVSMFHFGAGDVAFADRYVGVRDGRHAGLRIIALGALPIVIPVLAHPRAALTLLPNVTAVSALLSHEWSAVRYALLGAAAIAVLGETLKRARHPATPAWFRWELPLAFAAFVFAPPGVAPPGVAFFCYFGAWHAARHTLRLAEAYGVDPYNASLLRSARPLASFARRALPMTAAAIGLAVVLAALLARTVPLSVVAAALAFAVTVPHTFAVRFFNRAVAKPRWAATESPARVAQLRGS